MRVVAIHLLNDRSGSPLVFRQALETLVAAGAKVELLTATPGTAGFLSNLPGVQVQALPYRRYKNSLLTLLAFCYTQLVIFWRVFFLSGPDTVLYINTLLPASAALAGWLRGAPVVYHLHEVSVRPALLRRILVAVAIRCSTRVIYVSEYLRTALALPVPSQVINNALDTDFCVVADSFTKLSATPFTVLMACSLRDYKGVPEFLNLAKAMPQLHFELVLNASAIEVAKYKDDHSIPANLTLFPAVSTMHWHYQRAAVVVNLSRPDEWVETFGMTVLEAMRYGRPVIVPLVGGVAEVNLDGQTGYAIDGRNLSVLVSTLELLSTQSTHYTQMAAAARRRAMCFSSEEFCLGIRRSFADFVNKDSQVMVAQVTTN